MPISGLWKDIGRPRDLLDANLRMAEARGRAIDVPGARCRGPVVASRFTAGGCDITGPAFIGEDAVIGSGASLSSCAIGDRTEVGGGTVIEDSFLMDRCSLGAGCVIRGSLMGRGCRLGAGVQVIGSVLGDGIVIDGPQTVEGRTIEQVDQLK